MLRVRSVLSIFFAFAFVPLFSQVSENFNDGDFTNAPHIWAGTNAVWDATNMALELNATGSVPTTLATLYYLSTPFVEPSLDSTSWEFDVTFTTSLQTNNNYAEVYLTSDIANLSGSNNGYFVRLMNGSTTAQGKRKISLWKSVNGSKSVLINGQDSVFSATNLGFRVRVTRNAANNWTLEYDSTLTGNNYVAEPSVVDGQFNSSAFFGIRERHTAQSRNDWVSLDNVNVETFAALDVTPPTVLSVSVLNNTQLEVEFDEFVDVGTATMTGNYFRSGMTQPTNAQVNAADSARVTLTFTALQNCIQDSLVIQNVQDRATNTMATDTLPFVYCVTPASNFKDVVINEIFADPTDSVCFQPESEFIELYNRSNHPVNLQGWWITDAGNKLITMDSYLLNAGDYVVLSKDSAWANFAPNMIVMDLSALTNGGDMLGLRDSNFVLIDTATYTTSSWNPGTNDGFSLELINPDDTCTTTGNWSASTDTCQATPGVQNSIYNTTNHPPYITTVTITGGNSLEVCFNEAPDSTTAVTLGNYTVSAAGTTTWSPTAATWNAATPLCVNLTLPTPLIEQDTVYTISVNGVTDCNGNDTTSTGTFLDASPFGFKDIIINEIYSDDTPDTCGQPVAEFIELYNRSNRPVNLQGWFLVYDGGSFREIDSSYVLNAGAYVALSDDPAWATFASGNFLHMPNFPGLINSNGEIGLYDQNMVLIDTVFYEISFWQPGGDQNGISTELINPNDTCSLVGNWRASTAPCLSTPGAQNSAYDPTNDTTAPVVTSVTVVAEDSLLICFDGTMDLTSLENAALYAIDSLTGNSPVNPVFATGVGPGYDCAYLVLSPPLDTGVFYSVTTTMLADCWGNDTTQVDTFVLGGAPGACQVIISEFMADPADAGLLPDADFIELYNVGPTAVELFNWAFVRNGGNAEDGFPRYTLNPGEYLILCDDDPGIVSAYSQFGPTLGVDFPQMNISGDNIELLDGNGNLVDRIFYTEDWYNAEVDDKGMTYERRNVTACCLDAMNWGVSLGTPGSLNTLSDRNYIDQVPPEITSVEILNNMVIRINFNEFMNAASLQVLSNYSIGTNGDQPMATFLSFQDENSVTFIDVQLPYQMDSNLVYCLTVTDLLDCPGNAIASQEICFGLPAVPVAGDVVINEILFDPVTGGKDYVELYNNSNKIIDLSTLHITLIEDGLVKEEDPIVTTQVLLLPQSYICFTEDPAFQDSVYGPLADPTTVVYGDLPSYGNTDTCVVYIDSVTTNILDQLAYDDDWHFPNLDSKDGVSLERINFDAPTQDQNNWHSAASTVNYGTPGYVNSEAFMPEERTEVWLEPETFSPDQDGFEDFTYINFNFSTPGWDVRATVYDGRGRLVKTALQNTLLPTSSLEGVVKWDGTNDAGQKVDIGVYVILVEAQNPNPSVLETRRFKLGCVVAAKR